MRRENREFTRLAMHAKATMLLEDQYIEGEVENLSLKGTFIEELDPRKAPPKKRGNLVDIFSARAVALFE
jgi:hypothetical protein